MRFFLKKEKIKLIFLVSSESRIDSNLAERLH